MRTGYRIGKVIAAVAIVVGACAALWDSGNAAFLPPVAKAASDQIEGLQAIQGKGVSMAAPLRYTPMTSQSPAEPSAQSVARREAFMDRAEQAWSRRAQQMASRLSANRRAMAPSDAAPGPGLLSSSTGPSGLDEPGAEAPDAPGPLAATSFEIHLRSDLTPPFASSVDEPAAASSGRYIFYTNNWYAARSASHAGGSLPWLYIDPEADMPDFCCDQDAIYDKGRDFLIWERLAISPINVQNKFRLSTSTNGGVSFCTYDFFPSAIGHPEGFYDYPRLSLSNNHLYITLNLFNNDAGGAFIANLLLRMPLDELSKCQGFTYFFWHLPEDGWSPAGVENAREVMYLGDNPAYFELNDRFRVFLQAENSLTLSFVDRIITPYLFTAPGPPYQAVCRVPGGANPCGRADQRVIGAVLARDQLDFFWNVKQGEGFPFPYVESAGFDTRTLAYNARKFVWNPDYTWFYAAVGANDREHVGMSVLRFRPTAPADHWVAIEDDFNPAPPPGWEVAFVRASTANWTANNSGDYLRARTSHPQGVAWIGTGYTRQVGRYEPHFVEWRRGRDVRGTNRFQTK